MSVPVTGIYKITNIVNSKFYIGSSSNDIQMRWRRHKSDLMKNRHANKHLQLSWNKYGQDSFKFEIIEHCEPSECLKREQYYIDTLNPAYNKLKVAGSHFGVKRSLETRLKMSQSLKGNQNAKGNKNMAGKKLSKETRELLSKKLKGKKSPNRKKIIDNLGNLFESITHASRLIGVPRTTINAALKYNRAVLDGRTFAYVLEGA